MNWILSNSANVQYWISLALPVLLAAWLAAGCGKSETKVYNVPKDSPPQPQPPTLPAGHPDIAATPAKSGFIWKLPAGWTEIPRGEMRVASFKVNETDGKQAEVSVIPLPGMAGGDAANVNRWRGQVGLPPLEEDVLRMAAQTVHVGGKPAELYDTAGANPATSVPTRILGVIQHRADTAWFFKMTGDDALVAQQKPAFIEFLKSFQSAAAETSATSPPLHPPIDGNAAAPSSSMAVSSASQPKWDVPLSWKEVPAGQFLIAKFSITGEVGARAAVNVSKSSGDGGGLAANVNRWRGQLGQPAWTAAELEKQAKEIEAAGGKATLVEMSGTDARSGQPASLTGAIVSRPGETWFYKLMGDAKVAESQKESFIKFVKDVKY